MACLPQNISLILDKGEDVRNVTDSPLTPKKSTQLVQLARCIDTVCHKQLDPNL